jgi:hypothetical protein
MMENEATLIVTRLHLGGWSTLVERECTLGAVIEVDAAPSPRSDGNWVAKMHREHFLSEIQITAMDSVFFIVLPYIIRDLRSCFPPVLSKSFSILMTDLWVSILGSQQPDSTTASQIPAARLIQVPILYLTSRQCGTNPLETSGSASSGFGTVFGRSQARPRQSTVEFFPKTPN